MNIWADDVFFMRGNNGYVVKEPDFTDGFRQFLELMYGANWERRTLQCKVMAIEQPYAFVTGYDRVTDRLKRVWLYQIN